MELTVWRLPLGGTKTPELLQLYALTRNVSTEIVPDINQNDSTVYVFSDSVYAEAAFNADTDTWDIAQNTLSTTTVIPEIYVENGSLVIGIKGEAASLPGTDNIGLPIISAFIT